MADEKIKALQEVSKTALFEMLNEYEPSFSPEALGNQIETLTTISEFLHKISRIEGTVGYSSFHHALRMAGVIDGAIGNLRRVETLSQILRELK